MPMNDERVNQKEKKEKDRGKKRRKFVYELQ